MAQASVQKKTVLVLGATGYLGQFLTEDLAKTHKVGIVHHSTKAPNIQGDVHHFWADLSTGEGLQEAFDTLGAVDVAINCAAISSPAACERQPEQCRAINVPTRLLDLLDIHKLQHDNDTLLIHFSSDQVYDGSRPYWREDDGCSPCNVYGVTKREAEVLIQDRWPNHVILRSSLIFGPQSPVPVSRLLFLQFIERTLGEPKKVPVKFFSDEFRSPIFVYDIVRLVHILCTRAEPPQQRLFNLGGPERLSRADMAFTVANIWGYSTAAIEVAEASSVRREVDSPADISMDSARLRTEFPDMHFTSLAKALQQMRPPEKNGEVAE